MHLNSLRTKVSLYLLLVLSAALVLFVLLVLKYRQEAVEAVLAKHVTLISEVVVASTRHAMLVNRRDVAEKIIEDIGRTPGVERIRVINADGTIVHSNHPAEVLYSVQQSEEPCVHCHQSGKPLERVPDDKRWKIYAAPDGHRVLATMHAIRNEPTCSSASCHEHPASQSVLGVVDIAYSLNDIDQSITKHAWNIGYISFGFIVLFSVSIGVLLQRLIYVPLRDLESGAKSIALGNFGQPIPIRSNDEFGRVAASFNQMADSLDQSCCDMQDMVQTLELKVKERTQELLVAEAEIAQSEKLASVGLLAAGVAHELNNPLTGVLTFTTLMRKTRPDGSQDAEDLDLVIRETKRCASIIKRLLDFAREKVPVKGLLDLNLLIGETVRFVDRTASLQGIVIATDLDPELPRIWGDADLIKQVVMNLLVNAEQAIESNGRIVVETRPHFAPALEQPGVEPVPMVEVSVTDTGCGIPESNFQRIFDPFFTSKSVGKGTGLGLSVSYGIIKAHGGKINVESVIGKGSTFRVYLPVTPSIGEAEHNAAENTP